MVLALLCVPGVAAGSVSPLPRSDYTVHDTSPECEYRYEEAKVKHVLYWCTIGGHSPAYSRSRSTSSTSLRPCAAARRVRSNPLAENTTSFTSS